MAVLRFSRIYIIYLLIGGLVLWQGYKIANQLILSNNMARILTPKRVGLKKIRSDFETASLRPSKISYTGRGFRDPFDNSRIIKLPSRLEPVRTEEVISELDLSSMKITAMIWDSPRPQTIINGVIYEVGDEIMGAKIMKIDKEGVHLFFKGKEYLLRID